jgi:hypothetical protein
MKIRLGFVSNSSSSSFVCDVCEKKYEGWDGEYGFEVFKCENGHEICDCVDLVEANEKKILSHLKEKVKNLAIKYKDSPYMSSNFYKELYEKIKDLDSLDDVDPDEYNDAYEDGKASIYCPICTFKTYSLEEMAQYLSKKYAVNRDELFRRIKSENKRIKKIYNSEVIEMGCRDLKVEPEDLLLEIKNNFVIWERFNAYLSEE